MAYRFANNDPSVTRSLSDSFVSPLLLQLLRSLHNTDSYIPASTSTTKTGADDSDNYASASSDEDESKAAVKRVFCNGFTGCGGRHRDRSRRQEVFGKRLIPLLVKRPFCNSFGCYNGKRSGLETLETDRLLGPVREGFLEGAGLADDGEEVGSLEMQGRKRLFCNGYGGCRGSKRALYSNWLQKMNNMATGSR